MTRNMVATANKAKGSIPTPYDITYSELQELFVMLGKGDIFDAFTTAFDYGFMLGARAQKAGKFQAK